MAILMQVVGRSVAAMQLNSVFRQQQLAIAAQTCAAQARLDIYGVGPAVLTDAANRLVAANLAASTGRLMALLRVSASPK